jgi:hypothetical protein
MTVDSAQSTNQADKVKCFNLLAQKIRDRFDKEEMGQIATVVFGIGADELDGQLRESRAFDLVRKAIHRRKLQDLIGECRKRRERIEWPQYQDCVELEQSLQTDLTASLATIGVGYAPEEPIKVYLDELGTKPSIRSAEEATFSNYLQELALYAVLSVVCLALGAVWIIGNIQFADKAIASSALITQKWTQQDNPQQAQSYLILIEYDADVDGVLQKYQRKMPLSLAQFDAVKEGDLVDLQYLPDRPDKIATPYGSDTVDVWAILVMFAGAIICIYQAFAAHSKHKVWVELTKGVATTGIVYSGWQEADKKASHFYFAYKFIVKTEAGNDEERVAFQEEPDAGRYKKMYIGQRVKVKYLVADATVSRSFL